MHYLKKYAVTIFICLSVAGCSFGEKFVKSKYNGQCYQSNLAFHVHKTPAYYGTYEISTKDKLNQSQLIGSFPVGSKLWIKEIVLGNSGSYGHYFLVKVEIEIETSDLVLLPTRVISKNPWVTSTLPKADPNALIFNPKYLQPCR